MEMTFCHHQGYHSPIFQAFVLFISHFFSLSLEKLIKKLKINLARWIADRFVITVNRNIKKKDKKLCEVKGDELHRVSLIASVCDGDTIAVVVVVSIIKIIMLSSAKKKSYTIILWLILSLTIMLFQAIFSHLFIQLVTNCNDFAFAHISPVKKLLVNAHKKKKKTEIYFLIIGMKCKNYRKKYK